MNTSLQLVLGAIITAAGLLTAAQGQIIYWFTDHGNRRVAEWFARRGDTTALNRFERDRVLLRRLIPPFLVIIGLVLLAAGISGIFG